ncbi:MAG: Gfo/Idh/MocA family oxidoreductase [Bacteroidota bacterium]
MKTIITYGTFDLFHQGHYNILKRAKEQGDYLIVGVTGEQYDIERGKLNVSQTIAERIENIRRTGLADKIITEEYEGQKISDIKKYHVDVFVIGSDWRGKFDFLKEHCEVLYLERTKDISSTMLRNKEISNIQFGIAGSGRIAERFVPESKYVSGCNIRGVYSRNIKNASKFCNKFELEFCTDDYEELVDKCDVIYIATPHKLHYQMTKSALKKGKHVLCEKPITLNSNQLIELYEIADKKKLVLMEGIKTAYSPGFNRLIDLAKFEVIGKICHIDATFTKLENKSNREFDFEQAGGSVNELASYPLLVVEKLLGKPKAISYNSIYENNVDIFTKINLEYEDAFATLKVGLGVKSEGDLVISGTKGYIYVFAPWWKTQEFEVRRENRNLNKKYFIQFDGDGLRYEISEFMKLINCKKKESWMLSRSNSINIVKVIEDFSRLNIQNMHN